MVDLKGKPILITGASSGIGAATARLCAKAGMPVLLAARRVDRLEALAEELRASGAQAHPIACDVNDAAACEGAVEQCVSTFGSIYAVFANAGYGFEAPVLERSDEQFRELLETNFFGSMHVVRPASAHMLRAGQGHILFCSSCLSKIGLPFYSAYCMSKAAQDYAARALRHELRSQGVFVSSVHPTSTSTEFFDKSKAASTGMRFDLSGRKAFMHPPEKVARNVVACLRKPRGEVWTSTSLRLSLGLAVMFPGLTDRVLRRMARKRGQSL